MFWKLIVVALVAGLAVIYQLEDDHDLIIVEKAVALPVNRIKAFQYISDFTKVPKWYPGTVRFDPVDVGPIEVGKHFTEVIHVPVIGELYYDCVIVGYESPQYLSYITNSWMAYRVEYEISRRESQSDPSLFVWRLYTRRRNWLFKYIVVPVVSFCSGQQARTAMFNLKYAIK